MPDAGLNATALALRRGLPVKHLYLRDAFPRDRWADLDPIARHWLGMHAEFRDQLAEMGDPVAN